MFERVLPDIGFLKVRGCSGQTFRVFSKWISAISYMLMASCWLFLLVADSASPDTQRSIFCAAIGLQIFALFLRSSGGLQSLAPEVGRLSFAQPCLNSLHEHLPRTPKTFAVLFRTVMDSLLLPLGYFAFEFSSTPAVLLGQCVVLTVPTESHNGMLWGSVTLTLVTVLVVHVVGGCVLSAIPTFRGRTQALLLCAIAVVFFPVVRLGASAALCVSGATAGGTWLEPLGPDCQSSSHKGAIAVVALSLMIALLTEHMHSNSLCCLERQEGAQSGDTAEYARARGDERRVHPLWLEWAFVTRTVTVLILVCSFTDRAAVVAFSTSLVGACLLCGLDGFTFVLLHLQLLSVSNVVPIVEIVKDACLVRFLSSLTLVALCVVKEMDASYPSQLQYVLAACWLGTAISCAVYRLCQRGRSGWLEPIHGSAGDPLEGMERDSALSF